VELCQLNLISYVDTLTFLWLAKQDSSHFFFTRRAWGYWCNRSRSSWKEKRGM